MSRSNLSMYTEQYHFAKRTSLLLLFSMWFWEENCLLYESSAFLCIFIGESAFMRFSGLMTVGNRSEMNAGQNLPDWSVGKNFRIRPCNCPGKLIASQVKIEITYSVFRIFSSKYWKLRNKSASIVLRLNFFTNPGQIFMEYLNQICYEPLYFSSKGSLVHRLSLIQSRRPVKLSPKRRNNWNCYECDDGFSSRSKKWIAEDGKSE
jgi:hypothetical protein